MLGLNHQRVNLHTCAHARTHVHARTAGPRMETPTSPELRRIADTTPTPHTGPSRCIWGWGWDGWLRACVCGGARGILPVDRGGRERGAASHHEHKWMTPAPPDHTLYLHTVLQLQHVLYRIL